MAILNGRTGILALIIVGSTASSLSAAPPASRENKFQKDTLIGKIELYDPHAAAFISADASIEVIAKGYKWSEGPVWVAGGQYLLFSDVPENVVLKWQQGKDAGRYLTPSGYTSNTPRKGEIGSNGLSLDRKGRLILCQSGNRTVSRMLTATDAPAPDYIVLAETYNGKRFNSPNDLVADSKNNIWFTDPIYGLPDGEKDSSRDLSFEGVYKISADDNSTTLVIDSIRRPNGIALSLDEKVLYVGSSDDRHPKWYAYNLDKDGKITGGRVLLDATALKKAATVHQGPDGMKIDKYGNIFGAGPDGINIISPAGKRLGLIRVFGRPTSNCAFNETKDILYITAGDLVLKVVLHPNG